MTVTVANTNTNNTFDYWRNRTNELAYAMTTYVVTTNSNTSTGNATISGTFTANVLVSNTLTVNVYNGTSAYFGNSTVNTQINATSIAITNSTANIIITSPNTVQISSSNTYYLTANGKWYSPPQISNYITLSTVSTTGTTGQLIDSFFTNTFLSAEYSINIKDNNANSYVSTKLLVNHNTGNVFTTEYGTLLTNGAIGVLSANIDSGSVRVYITPTSTNTSIRFVRITL